MTFAELVERSKRQLNAGQPQPHVWPDSEIDIAACVMQARDALARQVMMDGSRRAWLTQEFSLTLDGTGKGDLSAATSAIAGEILLDGIRMGAVLDADGSLLKPLLHYSDFLSPQATVYGYYCLKDRALLTRTINVQASGPLEIVGASSPLTITANYVPSAVDDFPVDLEADLVQSLVNIVAAKVATPANADA
jgi:hypothetical protein